MWYDVFIRSYGSWAENRTKAVEFFLGVPVGTDEEIFDKIKAQQDVLAEIVAEIAHRYGNDLLQFCGRILVTYQSPLLQDVVQEVFKAVYRNIQQYNINYGAQGIKPWLYGIARNKCIDELRNADRLETELELGDPGGEEKEERYIQIIIAKRAFVELTTKERLMIATDLIDWFSRKEMASMFGYDNPESYDRQMYRIRQKMKKIVEG